MTGPREQFRPAEHPNEHFIMTTVVGSYPKPKWLHRARDLSEDDDEGRVDPTEAAFAILGVPPGATLAEVKRAYRDKVKDVHRDRDRGVVRSGVRLRGPRLGEEDPGAAPVAGRFSGQLTLFFAAV